MKKILKIILIVFAVIFAVFVFASSIVSPVAKTYVNNHGKDLTGREINVAKLRVNIFTGRVKIFDFTMMEDDDRTSFVHFDTLDVSVKLRKLLAQEVYVRHVVLASPTVRVARGAESFNFQSLIDFFTPDDEPDDDDESTSPWKLGFYNIRLSDGAIEYHDMPSGNRWGLNNMNIVVPGIYLDGSQNTDAGVALKFAGGGELFTDVSYNMDDNSFGIDLKLSNLALADVQSIVSEFMNVNQMNGTLSVNVTAGGNLNEPLAMDISGVVSMNNVDITDGNDVSQLALKSLEMKANKINIAENLFNLESIDIVGLQSRFDLYSDGNNFSRLFAKKNTDGGQNTGTVPVHDTVTVQSEKQDSRPLNASLNSLNVDANMLVFNDHTLPDNFEYKVKQLSIKANNVTTEGDNAAKIFVSLPDGGMALVNWKGRIDNWKQMQKLSLNIKNIHLADFSPYSVAYLGHPFTNGTFSFVSENSIRNSRLDGKNKIDLYNPSVGSKRKDVDAKVNIPLGAALYVLKDKDGKVEFTVPVSGNIDSPEFSYMKIVWKTLGNLLVKVATSPLRAVANALGKGDDLDFLEADPLLMDFSSEQYDILSRLVEVLQYDSTIVLELNPETNMSEMAVSQSLFNLKRDYYLYSKGIDDSSARLEMIDRVNIEQIPVKDAGFCRYLKEKGMVGSARPSEKEIRRVALERYPVEDSESQLQKSWEMRERFLRHYFVDQMGLDADRIVISSLNKEGSRNGYVIFSSIKGEE